MRLVLVGEMGIFEVPLSLIGFNFISFNFISFSFTSFSFIGAGLFRIRIFRRSQRLNPPGRRQPIQSLITLARI